jgi:hypothetical protein
MWAEKEGTTFGLKKKKSKMDKFLVRNQIKAITESLLNILDSMVAGITPCLLSYMFIHSQPDAYSRGLEETFIGVHITHHFI